MSKELLIYGAINDDSAEAFINAMNAIAPKSNLSVRVNSNGGGPEAMYGMVFKFKSHSGGKSVFVDGKARSSGFFFPVYADYVECLDVSSFMIHRAAYPEAYERDLMSDDSRSVLVKINNDLRSAVEAKLNIPKFEEITGRTMDQIFSMDSRIDVSLNAEEAKAVGLVDKINVITPSEALALNSQFEKIAAEYNVKVDLLEINNDIRAADNEHHKINNMNIEELKSKHPSIYAEVFNLGVSQGVEKEKDRVLAWSELSIVDAEASMIGIKEGKEITTSSAIKIIAEAETKRLSAIEASDDAPEIEAESSVDLGVPEVSAGLNELRQESKIIK